MNIILFLENSNTCNELKNCIIKYKLKSARDYKSSEKKKTVRSSS